MASYYDIGCSNGVVIDTTVTDRASMVGQWLSKINSYYPSGTVVGLDIEWKPNRWRGQDNPAATLQLCVADSCLIVQLIHLDLIPRSLRRFLADQDFIFAGVGAEEDAHKLWRDYELECGRVAELRDFAVQVMPRRFPTRNAASLKAIAQEFTGIYLEKPNWITRSNWDTQTLTYEQVEYACLDAYASYAIADSVGVD